MAVIYVIHVYHGWQLTAESLILNRSLVRAVNGGSPVEGSPQQLLREVRIVLSPQNQLLAPAQHCPRMRRIPAFRIRPRNTRGVLRRWATRSRNRFAQEIVSELCSEKSSA
jgi:hypothetical protein